MPGTFSQILLHIVFGTRHRRPWIAPDVADRLYAYVGGIVQAERGILHEIDGTADHIHMFVRWRPEGSIADLLRVVKARSSRWVHDTFPALPAWRASGRG